MATRKVVRGVLLSADQLLWVEQLAVGARPHLVDDRRLQIDEDAARHVLAGSGLGEEGVEGIVRAAHLLVRRDGAVRGDAVLEAVQLPAGVSDLDTGLSLEKAYKAPAGE